MSRLRYILAALALTATIVGFSIWLRPRHSAAAKHPPRQTFGPVITAPQSGRLHAEFEPQDAVMLGFNELVQFHPQTLVDIVRAINGRVQIIGLISAPEQEQQVLELLHKNQVATGNIDFFFWPAISMWVQDFGPMFLIGDDIRVVDYCYGFPDREAENQLCLAFAAKYGMKIANSRLTMEGGNLLTNGRGFCLTSSIVIAQNESRGYDVNRIAAILKNDFRMSQWSYLLPLDGEPTAHIDMFLTIVDPMTVVLGKYNGPDDPTNTLRLEKNADILSSVRIDDQPLKVVRIPMPSRHDGKWRTYTNVIFANGLLLVPQYPDYCPELDAQALEIYRKLLPNWEVVGIDASSLIAKRGSLHCVSLSIPKLPKLNDAE